MELPEDYVVYAYMNGAIFKLFGAAILLFDLLLVLTFGLAMPLRGMSPRSFVEVELLFFGFLIVSALIAVGLIRVQRWAAGITSVLGLVCSLVLAMVLGSQPWTVGLIGIPVVFGLLLPLYATVENWSSLKSVNPLGLNSFVHALRSSDPLHLG